MAKGSLGFHVRRLPYAALLALALVGVFEFAFVWQNRYRLWNTDYSLVDAKRQKLQSGEPPDEVAIFGVSRFYHVDPQVVAEAMSVQRVSNYSWASCGMETYEVMLRALISPDRKPRVILVDSFPEIFSYRPELLKAMGDEMNQTRYLETVPMWAALQTAWRLGDGPMADKLLAYNLMPPSARYSSRVIRGLKSLKGTGALPDYPKEFDRKVGAFNRTGWFTYPSPADRVATEEEFIHLEKVTGSGTLRDNPYARKVFEDFIGMAQMENIRVVMLPVPNSERAYRVNETEGIFAAHERWLDKLEAAYANFHAPKPRHIVMPGKLGDATHVNLAGAQEHMKLIGEILRAEKLPGT